MRVIALILVIVTLLVGAFVGYCFYGAQMQIEGVATTLTPATEAEDTFADLVSQVNNGTFTGTTYYAPEFATAENYTFMTLTVRMQNRGAIPMEWIRIEVSPDAKDVLQLAADRTPALAPNTRSDFSTTLLTHAGAPTTRKVTVTYYVLGHPFSATYDMNSL